MRRSLLLLLLPLAACLCGCASKAQADSALPPGVRKNTNRAAPPMARGGKPIVIGEGKGKP